MKPDLNCLGLGMGVQSSTIAMMASVGCLEKPEFGIFSDTQNEPSNVYEWKTWVEKNAGFPILTTSRGNLATESLRVRISKKTGRPYIKHAIPTFILRSNGRKGMMPRHCTLDFKIEPLKRLLNKLRERRKVVLWLGISTDEASRMKPSRIPWISHRYPLIEMGMSRSDCLSWMKFHGFPTPPSSACVFCPFRSDAKWKQLTPEEFAAAVSYEKNLQETQKEIQRIDGIPFLHASRIPLEQVKFTSEGELNMHNECEGHCGL